MSDVSTPAPIADPLAAAVAAPAPVDPSAVSGIAADPAADAAAPVAPAPVEQPAPASVPADSGPSMADVFDLIQSLRDEVATLKAQVPAAPAPPIPDNPPSPVNLFEKKDLIVYKWNDPYDGPSQKLGFVVDTHPDEGVGAQSSIAWLGGGVSGPIGDHLLSAV